MVRHTQIYNFRLPARDYERFDPRIHDNLIDKVVDIKHNGEDGIARIIDLDVVDRGDSLIITLEVL